MTLEKITIGTSGFTYSSGRKGENLYGKLAHDGLFADCEFIASGRGWPVKTDGYSWDDMQKFYHKLNIYVCTSSVEGIGYGPLEAMACGIPVVIPIDVGIFDELPDLENLHRYKAGNYDDLKRALLEAIDKIKTGAINVPSLRSAVVRFSPEHWIEDFINVFENFLYGVETIKPQYDWQNHSCIVYVAYGKPALDCVTRAIASAKKYMPHVKTVLVSEKPGYGEDVHIPHSDDDIGARSVKTEIYDLVPSEFEYVLYLDADTEIVADISILFQFLQDGWDWIMCINPAQYVLTREMERPDNKDEIKELFEFHGTDEMLQLNGGVFGFRRHKHTARLMRDWHRQWLIYGKRDQAAFDRAFYSNPVRLYALGNEFNTITRYISAEKTAGILHYPLVARRWKGRIEGRLDSSEAWGSVMPSLDEFKNWNK